jgi:hypothetical protein
MLTRLSWLVVRLLFKIIYINDIGINKKTDWLKADKMEALRITAKDTLCSLILNQWVGHSTLTNQYQF